MFKLIPVLFLLALKLNADIADEARSAASSARISSIGSQGAVQVTQVHTEAQTKILVNLVEQNDQIIWNLKNIAAAKGDPTQDVSRTVKALSEEISKIQNDSLKLLKSQGDAMVQQHQNMIKSIHEQKHEVLPKFDKMQAILVGLQCVSTMGILVIATRQKLASK